MSHENMPGYRPPDTHPSQASTEDGTVTAYAQEQRQELENLLHFAEQQIARITGRINEYDIADRAIPEEILTELNEWVDVAHQITWSLIRDLFEQQGLDITQVQELIDEQAPMLSWCTNINSYFQQKLNESLHTANSQVSSVRTEESLTPQEFVSAQEALAGLTDILKGVFVRQPEFRNKPALLGTILLFSLLLLLIPAFSPRDQNTSLFDHLEVPAAQVAAHYSDQHLSTPIPNLSSNLPTSSSTPQPPAIDSTPRPPSPTAQVTNLPLDATQDPNQSPADLELAIEDAHYTSIGAHVQNPELKQVSAEVDSEEFMLQASIQLQDELREMFFSESGTQNLNEAVTRELDPILDKILIDQLTATIGNDYSLDFSSFSKEEQRVLMPGRMLLVEPNSGLVAHSALIELGENTQALILPYHVLEALINLSGNNYYLCYNTSAGLRFVEITQFAASVARNVVNPSDEAWVAVDISQFPGLASDVKNDLISPLLPIPFDENKNYGVLGHGEVHPFAMQDYWNSADDVDTHSFPHLSQEAKPPVSFIYGGFSGSSVHALNHQLKLSGYTVGSAFRVPQQGGAVKCDIVANQRDYECYSDAIIRRIDLTGPDYEQVQVDIKARQNLAYQYTDYEYVIVDSVYDLYTGEVIYTVQEHNRVEGTFKHIGENGLPEIIYFSFGLLSGDNKDRWGGLVVESRVEYEEGLLNTD